MAETIFLPETGKADERIEQRTGLTPEELDLIVATAIAHADVVRPLPQTDGPKAILIGERHRRRAADQAGFGHQQMWTPAIIGGGELNFRRSDKSDTPPTT